MKKQYLPCTPNKQYIEAHTYCSIYNQNQGSDRKRRWKERDSPIQAAFWILPPQSSSSHSSIRGSNNHSEIINIYFNYSAKERSMLYNWAVFEITSYSINPPPFYLNVQILNMNFMHDIMPSKILTPWPQYMYYFLLTIPRCNALQFNMWPFQLCNTTPVRKMTLINKCPKSPFTSNYRVN